MTYSNLPATLEEANTRIVAYIDKLKSEGKSEQEAYNIAISWFKKFKHHYASPKASLCGHCKICGYPILHLVDEYTVCAIDTGKSEMWHILCETESIEQVPDEINQSLS